MSSAPAQIQPVVGAKEGTVVEIVPGRRSQDLCDDALPPLALAEVIPQGGGTFRLVARMSDHWFSNNTKTLRRLGIGISGTSMKRLIRAGFVEGQQTTPQVHQFNYHSYLKHMERARDPEFWDQTDPGHTKTNRERFRDAIY